MEAVSILEADLAAISSDRASEGGEGPVVDSLPSEREALVDVGEVVVEDVESCLRGKERSRPGEIALPVSQISLWGGAGPPGGTVRRAAVRKRGSGSTSLY